MVDARFFEQIENLYIEKCQPVAQSGLLPLGAGNDVNALLIIGLSASCFLLVVVVAQGAGGKPFGHM